MAIISSDVLKKLLFSKPVRVAASAVLGIIAAWFVGNSSIGRATELNALDIQFKIARDTRMPDSSIVILTIDQNSLQYFKKNGRISWPWSRDFYAITTDYLAKAGAKAIVFDFHFNEPDIDRVTSSGIENDSLFAAAVRNAGNVFFSAQLTNQETEDQEGDTLAKFPEKQSSLQILREYQFDKTYAPLIPFQEAAKAVGVVNFIPDEDGVFRSLPLEYKYHEKQIFTLSYAVLKDLMRSEADKIKISSPLLLYWYGKGGPSGVFQRCYCFGNKRNAGKNTGYSVGNVQR